MMRASFAWRCLLFAALVCGWVVLAHSQSKKLWQVYAEAGETAFQEGRRPTAEAMLLSAIKEAESESVQDPWLGKINNELGQLYSSPGYENHGKAESYFLAAIGIFEKLKESSNVALAVINLSLTYQVQDKYSEAGKCVKEGLEFVEQSKTADDKTVASLIDMLAMIHVAQNRIEEAEAAYVHLQSLGQAGKLYPKTLEDEAQSWATWFLYKAKRYPEAERLLKGELALLKKQSALTSLAAANAFNALADVYYGQRHFKEAETEKKQSIEITKNLIAKKVLDPDTNPTDWALADLALTQYALDMDSQAEPLFQQSLASMKQRREKSSGEDRTGLARQIAEYLERLAKLHCDRDRNAQAAPLYKEALEIREKDVGQDDPGTIATTKAYMGVLRKLKRDAEAEELEARLRKISE
jgi:tetratricopeptide (TPR) repeat protein